MYTLNIKKMKIELKNIYTSERFSEETTCFKSDLFCDGKKVGYCKNDGQGGNTHYEGIGYHYEKIKDMEEYCKTLPPIVYTKEEHGSDFTINMTLEHYIDDLLMKFLDKKEEVKPNPATVAEEAAPTKESYATGHPSIAAKKVMDENGIPANHVNGPGKDGRITTQDVVAAMAAGFSTEAIQGWGGTRNSTPKKMSMLRRKVAERLVAVKNETAMLTTFNEVDMKPIMDVRTKYKAFFKEHHEVNLGFMSFFTKAVTEALNLFPAVNAQVEGKNMILHDYADIGIAVSSPKGLMVPVVRNAEQMTLAEIEKEIKRLAIRARDGKISPDEMTGGTFTITNGGVFGSMLSTPIINPPQSAILGMHNIVERAVVVDGEIVVRPIMYVALSYDHRVIDGKESVSFLFKVKEMLENPEKMIFGGKDPIEVLLGL